MARKPWQGAWTYLQGSGMMNQAHGITADSGHVPQDHYIHTCWKGCHSDYPHFTPEPTKAQIVDGLTRIPWVTEVGSSWAIVYICGYPTPFILLPCLWFPEELSEPILPASLTARAQVRSVGSAH